MSQTQNIALTITSGSKSLTPVEQANSETVFQNLAGTPGIQEHYKLKVRRAKNSVNQRVEAMYVKPYQVANSSGNLITKYASVAMVTSVPDDCPSLVRQELLEVMIILGTEPQTVDATVNGAAPL